MANSGVNVKMGVTGIAQFKQNISTAKQSLKTLDAQLALNKKQYEATGDAEAYMEEKSQLLKLKLEEQKAVVANTESALKSMADNGVDKSSKSFQEMQRQLLSAKGDLLDTQKEISNISDTSDDAGDNVDEMNRQLREIGKGISFQNVTEGLGKINDSIGQVIRKAGRMGRALLNNVRSSAAWADELKTRSTTWGVSTSELQKMDQVADYVETDTDTILAAKDKMVKNVNKGSSETMGAFAAINKAINPKDFIHSKEGIEDLFWEAGEYINSLTDEGEKEAYAMSIFGKSWRDLVPLFSTGREEYNRLMEAQHVVSEKQLDSLGEFDDSMQNLTNEWETFRDTIMGTLAEGLNPLLQTLGMFMGKLNEYLASEEGQAMLQKLSELIAGLFESLTKIDPDKVMEGIMGAFKKIEEGLQWISDNKDNIVEALKVIGVAFAGLKVVEIALGLGKIVGGFKNLLGLGAEKATEQAATTAATHGGIITTAKNWMTGASTKATGFMLSQGLLPAVVYDMFMNQTKAGRALRDGGGLSGMWEGLKEDITDKADEIKHNYDTLADNWDPNSPNANVLAKLIGRRDENADAATRLESGANWAPSYMGGGMGAIPLENPASKVENAAEDLMGSNTELAKSTDFLSDATNNLQNLPGDIQSAVYDAISSIKLYIDGQLAGRALSPYVNADLGGTVLATQ